MDKSIWAINSNFIYIKNIAVTALNTVVVGSNGLEPSTLRLSGARSNRLSYEPV
jgi:hypothetical protein